MCPVVARHFPMAMPTARKSSGACARRAKLAEMIGPVHAPESEEKYEKDSGVPALEVDMARRIRGHQQTLVFLRGVVDSAEPLE